MRIAVAGASGLIGAALVPALEEAGHRVERLVRPGTAAAGIPWDPAAGLLDAGALEGVDAVINLAGRGIGARRWDDEERRLIWEKIWPENAPRRADLPLERMAERFEISGGNIKNIALAAAFLAAHDGGEIAVRHLLRATRREYQKMGKILDDGDFRERMDE